MKRVRFEDPEEFVADCNVVFDRALLGLFESEKRPVELKDRILETICKDDVDAFMRYLCECAEIYSVDYFGDYSVLHVAVKKGAFAIVEQLLISQVIDIDTCSLDYDLTTPLFWAIKENCCAMVELLLDFGASSTLLNVYGDSAVFVAVNYSHVSVLRILVQRGCNCNYQIDDRRIRTIFPTRWRNTWPVPDEYGVNKESPLSVAIRNNCVEAVVLLVQGGANTKGDEAKNLLTGAIQCRGTADAAQEIINIVVSRGTKEDSEILVSCLQNAVRFRNTDLVSRLLQHVHGEDNLRPALQYAVSWDSLPLIKLVLSYGAKLTAHDIDNLARFCRAQTLDYILSNYSWPIWSKESCIHRVVDRAKHQTTYQLASLVHPRERMWFMSDKREDISRSHSQFIQTMQLLLDHGAHADSRHFNEKGYNYGETGTTGIHICLENGLVCPSLFLLMAGADPMSPDKNGHTPFYTIIHQLLQIDRMHYKKKENLCRMLHGLDVITASHSKEATKIAALLTRPDFSATLDKLPDHVVSILTRTCSEPNSLMNICRMQIVKSCAPNSHRKIHSLHLPTAIKKYLLFRDLDEMLLDMAGRKRKCNNNGAEQTVPKSEEFTKLSDSSESEEDEDKDYEVPEVKNKKKRGKRQKKVQLPTPPKPRKKLCLCTI